MKEFSADNGGAKAFIELPGGRLDIKITHEGIIIDVFSADGTVHVDTFAWDYVGLIGGWLNESPIVRQTAPWCEACSFVAEDHPGRARACVCGRRRTRGY